MLDFRAAAATTRSLAEVVRQIWKALRILFQEVLGFTFFVLGAWGVLWLVRSYHRFQGDGESVFKMVVVALFVLMMGACGFSSFRRARRIARGK